MACLLGYNTTPVQGIRVRLSGWNLIVRLIHDILSSASLNLLRIYLGYTYPNYYPRAYQAGGPDSTGACILDEDGLALSSLL